MQNGAPYLTVREQVSSCKYASLVIVTTVIYLVLSTPLFLGLFYGIAIAGFNTWAAMAVGAFGSAAIFLAIWYGLKAMTAPKVCSRRTRLAR